MVIAAAQRRRPKSHAAGDNRPARRRRWSKGLTPLLKRIASARMSISTRLRHWQSECNIGVKYSAVLVEDSSNGTAHANQVDSPLVVQPLVQEL